MWLAIPPSEQLTKRKALLALRGGNTILQRSRMPYKTEIAPPEDQVAIFLVCSIILVVALTRNEGGKKYSSGQEMGQKHL